MTSEEAIKILRKGPPDIGTYPVNDYQNYHEDKEIYNEAMELAIKALEERSLKETTFDDYLKEQLKDPEFRKEWEKLRDKDMHKGEEE